jgi:hypothetical protein
MLHRDITATEFECPATNAAVFQADITQIEPSPVLRACVHSFHDIIQFPLTWLFRTTSSHTISNR